ncbi:MAG: hypothetical protein AAGC76_13800 [Luteibacter sp.]|uniref:hypothetical protein n=1 Tax=Luteibacter sp. TaxID=1886636 RepID=UPI002807B4F6|nr:hypothetical protein [Luteibacter sp.]MDQ7996907.1 hypothetical protein [Luteibacter sp.]MDQ8049278.1 hypothetical protein [Luteibacter sp.]
MTEEILAVGDELGPPDNLGNENGQFSACARVVWRKFGTEWRCIGVVFTVESRSGIIAFFRSATAAAENARVRNQKDLDRSVDETHTVLLPLSPSLNRLAVTETIAAAAVIIAPERSRPTLPEGTIDSMPSPPSVDAEKAGRRRRRTPK